MEQLRQTDTYTRTAYAALDPRKGKRRRPGNYQDTSYLDSLESDVHNVNELDRITLRWFSEDFCSEYSISEKNPDFRFLDTWYTDEVKALIEMNPDCPLIEKLEMYLRERVS